MNVREYLTADGRNPFREWLGHLDIGVRARIQARILRFEAGNLGDHKHVGAGVWEARLQFGPGYRVYFGRHGEAIVLLLIGRRPLKVVTYVARRSFGETTWRPRTMARRSADWNEGLAQDLRDQEFARVFLLAAFDEGVAIHVALGKVIRAMGVKEFANQVGMASPNVLRAIRPRHNPTHDTLNRLLKPFGLKLSLAPLTAPKRHRAA